MRIGVVEVFVDDQEKARAFYTNVLGFEVKIDVASSESTRWLAVVSPEDPGGAQLLLAAMTDAARALQEERRAAGTPAISFTTDDCERDYDELRSRRVTFHFPPRRMEYEGTDAVFEDGCGNLLNLHED
jgi:catechol 2,3-dioxygenase-like lactoylglutathione lyase family enzyme